MFGGAIMLTLTACPGPNEPTTFKISNSTSNTVLTNVMSADYDYISMEYFDTQVHGTLIPGQVSNPVQTSSTSRYVFFAGPSNTLRRTQLPFSILENCENILGIFNNTVTTTVYLSDRKSADTPAGGSFKAFEKEGVPEYLEVELSDKLNF